MYFYLSTSCPLMFFVSLTAVSFSGIRMFFCVSLNTRTILHNKVHGEFYVTWHHYSIDIDR
jgi:hypothetical protein